MTWLLRISGPGYVARVEPTTVSVRRHGDETDGQSLTVEDDARPVGRRSTRNSPRRKGIRRRVSVVAYYTCTIDVLTKGRSSDVLGYAKLGPFDIFRKLLQMWSISCQHLCT